MAATDDVLAKRLSLAISGNDAKVRAGQHGEGTPVIVRRIGAGKISLPTGRICVADAYAADAYPPLNRLVPAGPYAVELVIAQIPETLAFGGDRCAFAVVRFSIDATASWWPVTAVQTADPCFNDDAPNRFVQEGGTALFSPEAGAVHFAHIRQQFDQQRQLIRSQSQRFGSRKWVNYRPAQEPENVVIVEGGMGDGSYECFVGVNKSDRLTHLVIDFGIASVDE